MCIRDRIWIDGPTSNDELKKTGPVNHDIKVVVENFKSEKMKTIDAKIFNTVDWIGGGATKSEKKIVRFKITSGSMFANTISIPELGIHESKPFTPVHDEQGRHMGQRGQIKVTREKEVEVNKVYDVEVLSTQSREGVRLRTKGESVLEMEEHSDNDWKDLVCGATEGRFFDFNGNKCKYMVGSDTKVAGGVRGGTTRKGVIYQGPHLFHYTDSRWGKIINSEGVSPIGSPTQSLSESNDNIIGKKILNHLLKNI